MKKPKHFVTGNKHPQRGFSCSKPSSHVVLDDWPAGVLATLRSPSATHSVQNDSIARQKAGEAIESIYTARQTSQITFDKIRTRVQQRDLQGGIYGR